MSRALKLKTSDRDLAAFATAGEKHQCMEIIVELDQSGFKSAPPGHLLDPRGITLRKSHLTKSRDDSPVGMETMDIVEKKLAALHPIAGPVRIPIARAFALTVDSELMEQVAEMPEVSVIRPNRRHFVKH